MQARPLGREARTCWGGCEPRPDVPVTSGVRDDVRRSRGATGETDLGAVSFLTRGAFDGPVLDQARYAEAVRDPDRGAAGALLRAVQRAAGSAATVGGFEIDGNLASSDGLDWATVAALPGFSHQDDTTCTGSTDDTIFGTGSQKNDDVTYTLGCGSVPPNKNDLRRAYAYTTTTSGDVYLYLAYALESKTGSAHVDFEINKSSGLMANGIFHARTAGDLLISYDWNGSSEILITIRTWTGSSWGNAQTLDATLAQAAVNATDSVADPIAKDTYEAETFGEVGINLTAAGIFKSGVCQNFGSALPKTRSSGESFNSELKDYIKPFDVTITNCGTAKIVKTDALGAPLSGAKFTLYADGGDPSSYNAAVDTVKKGECTTDAVGVCTIPGLFPGTYWAVETTPPTGYVADTLAKKVVISAGGEVVTVTFANSHGKAEWEKRDATSGALVCCAVFKVTRTAPVDGLSFPAVYVKDDAGSGATVVVPGAPGVTATTATDANNADGVVRLTDLPTGTYQVQEVVPPTGYGLPAVATKTFTVSSSALVTTLTGGTAATSTNSSGAFFDPRLLSKVRVDKVDADDNDSLLDGAVFSLYRDANGDGALQPGHRHSVRHLHHRRRVWRYRVLHRVEPRLRQLLVGRDHPAHRLRRAGEPRLRHRPGHRREPAVRHRRRQRGWAGSAGQHEGLAVHRGHPELRPPRRSQVRRGALQPERGRQLCRTRRRRDFALFQDKNADGVLQQGSDTRLGACGDR